MIVINNIDSQKFSFNGVEYYKNFTPIVIGDKIRILNTYDSSIELTDSPRLYSEFSVNDLVFDNVASLQSYLLPIVFSRLSLNGDFLSNNISTYEEADTPISDTDQLFVIQGGVVKKVNKSEIGGGGTSSTRFYNATNSSDVTGTTSLVLVQTPVLIPAGTFKTGDCATFRARIRRTVPTNANTSLYLYISTLPSSATPVGQQMNYVVANLTNTLAQGKSEWVIKNQNNLTEIVNYTNNDDDIIGNDYRSRVIDWDVDQYIYIWIGNTNTATSSYFSFWELLKH